MASATTGATSSTASVVTTSSATGAVCSTASAGTTSSWIDVTCSTASAGMNSSWVSATCSMGPVGMTSSRIGATCSTLSVGVTWSWTGSPSSVTGGASIDSTFSAMSVTSSVACAVDSADTSFMAIYSGLRVEVGGEGGTTFSITNGIGFCIYPY